MLMADTMAIFFVVLGLLLAFPGLWLLCRGLWPNMVRNAAGGCRQSLTMAFLMGLPLTVLMIVAAIVLGKLTSTFAKIGSVGVICVYMVYAHTGVSGLATYIGERLVSPADAERPWKSTVRGGIVLELSYLLPILGWFLILPVSFIIGCGAVSRSILQHKRLVTVTAPVGAEGSVGAPQ